MVHGDYSPTTICPPRQVDLIGHDVVHSRRTAFDVDRLTHDQQKRIPSNKVVGVPGSYFTNTGNIRQSRQNGQLGGVESRAVSNTLAC